MAEHEEGSPIDAKNLGNEKHRQPSATATKYLALGSVVLAAALVLFGGITGPGFTGSTEERNDPCEDYPGDGYITVEGMPPIKVTDHPCFP